MCPVEPPEGNGKLLRYRLDRLEHRVKGDEEAARFLAEKGARNNEQIRVHGERLDQLHEDVHDMKPDVAKIPVLETKVDSLLDGWRAVRNAFFAAAGGLLILAATILYQATS